MMGGMKNSTQATLVLASLFLLGSLAPVPAQAATLEELTQQVKSLSAQVAQLQATLAARGSSATFTVLQRTVTFDQSLYTTISHNPEVGGKANVPQVFVIIRNAQSEGLVGTAVDVEKGVWKYNSVVYLPAGYYSVEVHGGDRVVTRNLHVL
jgi:outer membrane murein-binding lipoprotein Lpp